MNEKCRCNSEKGIICSLHIGIFYMKDFFSPPEVLPLSRYANIDSRKQIADHFVCVAIEINLERAETKN